MAVEVFDTGKGIEQHLLSKLTARGASFSKEGGSGLGLYHARTHVESWGGSMKIASEVEKGTSLHIILPRSTSPAWFLEKLVLERNSVLVIIDDDRSIHQLWESRIRSLGPVASGITIKSFSDLSEAEKWISNSDDRQVTRKFLVDYEFQGSTKTGLDFLAILGAPDRAHLVTSHTRMASSG